MKFTGLVFAAAIVTFSSSARATATSQVTSIATDWITVGPNAIVFQIDNGSGPGYPSVCTNAGAPWIILGPGLAPDQMKAYLATVMASLLTPKTVTVGYGFT